MIMYCCNVRRKNNEYRCHDVCCANIKIINNLTDDIRTFIKNHINSKYGVLNNVEIAELNRQYYNAIIKQCPYFFYGTIKRYNKVISINFNQCTGNSMISFP